MKNLISTIVLLSFLLSGCSTNYKILSDKEEGIDFSSYRSFKIFNHEHGFPKGANQINHQRIERAITNNLEALGYNETENPDVLIAWFVKVQTKTTYDVYNTYYQRWSPIQRVNIYNYKQGSLVIDIIDADTRQVIWHGRASDRVYDNMPNIDKKIKDVVKATFDQLCEDTNLTRVTDKSI